MIEQGEPGGTSVVLMAASWFVSVREGCDAIAPTVWRSVTSRSDLSSARLSKRSPDQRQERLPFFDDIRGELAWAWVVSSPTAAAVTGETAARASDAFHGRRRGNSD